MHYLNLYIKSRSTCSFYIMIQQKSKANKLKNIMLFISETSEVKEIKINVIEKRELKLGLLCIPPR